MFQKSNNEKWNFGIEASGEVPMFHTLYKNIVWKHWNFGTSMFYNRLEFFQKMELNSVIFFDYNPSGFMSGTLKEISDKL